MIRLTEPINPREPSFSFGCKGCTCREEESPLSVSLGRLPSRRESDFRRGRDSPTPTSWNLSKQRGGGATESYLGTNNNNVIKLASVHLLFSYTHLSFSHPLAQIHWEELVGLPMISHFIPRIMDFVGCQHPTGSASLVVSAARRRLGCSPDLTTLRNTNVR